MEDEGEIYVDESDEDNSSEAGSEIDMEHDHYDMGTDTSASQARKGKDIQGIPWDRLNITREKYRQTRIEQYKNYENVPSSGAIIDKECKQIEKGSEYYGFQHNTRWVKPTILHFQLRNLVWATSKHDVYLMSNYSVIHWSSLSGNMSEVINFSGHVAPDEKHAGSLLEGFMQTQISTLAVKDNLLVAGGFQGEITCKKLDRQGISFCTRTTFDDNAITNAIDIYDSPSGGIHFMASNNDCGLREFDAEEFQLLNHFTFPWPVNHTSMSPDCKLILVVGDHPDGLLVDSQNGKVVSSMVGHVDYSFASAWHPDGRIFATGNQDKTCRVWDIRNLSSPVAVLKGNLGAVRSIRFSSDGQFMAVAEPADFVHIYNTNMNYKKRQEIDFFGEVSGISLSPDDESLFIGVWDRTYGSLLHYSKKHAVLLQGFLREEEHHHGLVYGSMSDPHAHRSDSHGSPITIEGGDPTWPSDLDNGPPLKVGPIDGTAGEGDSTKKLLTATQEALVAAQTPMETPSQDIGIEETAAAGDKFNKVVSTPVTTPPDHVNGGQEQHGQQSSGGSSSGQDEGRETPARRHTCKPSKASVTQDAGCSVSECKTLEYSANSQPDSANVSLDVSANAEVAAEPGLSTPISNSEETPMQVVDVLCAVTGIDKHGVDPSALMDRLSPQAITALNSQIARIGSDALVTEIKSLLGVEAAKVGQTSIAEEHAVSTLPPPSEYEPRRSS